MVDIDISPSSHAKPPTYSRRRAGVDASIMSDSSNASLYRGRTPSPPRISTALAHEETRSGSPVGSTHSRSTTRSPLDEDVDSREPIEAVESLRRSRRTAGTGTGTTAAAAVRPGSRTSRRLASAGHASITTSTDVDTQSTVKKVRQTYKDRLRSVEAHSSAELGSDGSFPPTLRDSLDGKRRLRSSIESQSDHERPGSAMGSEHEDQARRPASSLSYSVTGRHSSGQEDKSDSRSPPLSHHSDERVSPINANEAAPQKDKHSPTADAFIMPPSTFKYETPMLASEGRVLRGAQMMAWANGVPTVTRATAPRTAPRSTAKTLRAVRVQQYIDPDEEEGKDEDKEMKKAEEPEQDKRPATESPERDGGNKRRYDEHLSDVESPGVARGMPLPSQAQGNSKWDSGRLLDQRSGMQDDEDDNPFDLPPQAVPSSRKVHTASPGAGHYLKRGNASGSGELVPPSSRPHSASSASKERRTPPADSIAAALVAVNDRSGSNLPGYELGAGDEEDADEGPASGAGIVGSRGYAHGSARQQAYPFHKRQPGLTPSSDENVDPLSSTRAASAAPLSRKTSGEKMMASAPIGAYGETTRPALGEASVNQLHARAVSQPAQMMSSAKVDVVGPLRSPSPMVGVAQDTEDYRMRMYEENMRREAIRQKHIPPERIRNWLNGKFADGNFRDLKTTTVKGFRFHKVRKAGEGGFSTVWVVRGPVEKMDTKEEIPEDQQAFYAMKQVNLKKLEPQSREDVLKEAEYLAFLATQPNYDKYMLRYFAHKSNDSHLKILIELGDCDYSDVLRRSPPTRWQLPKVFGQMIEAVHFLHEAKIVHTDLKPANFLLVGDSIKIIDLGIAQKIPMGTIHISRDALVGTPNYMAPEAITGSSSRSRGAGREKQYSYKQGKASDVWSMGCIMYQLVYGRPPFDRLTGEAKLKAIVDEKHVIEYPSMRYPYVRSIPGSGAGEDAQPGEKVDDDLRDLISRALQYHVADRATLPELLAHPALAPYTKATESITVTREDLYDVIRRVKHLVQAGEIADGDEPRMIENLIDFLQRQNKLRR